MAFLLLVEALVKISTVQSQSCPQIPDGPTAGEGAGEDIRSAGAGFHPDGLTADSTKYFLYNQFSYAIEYLLITYLHIQ